MKNLLLWTRENHFALDHVTIGSLAVSVRDLATPPSPAAEKQKGELLQSWIEATMPPEAIVAMKKAGAFSFGEEPSEGG